MHIAARLALHATTYDELVRVVRATGGASVFVLSGRHSIAGGSPPRHLPPEGSVRIGGQTSLGVLVAGDPAGAGVRGGAGMKGAGRRS